MSPSFSIPEEDSDKKKLGYGKLGKDPTVETSFLPDRYGIHMSLNLIKLNKKTKALLFVSCLA